MGVETFKESRLGCARSFRAKAMTRALDSTLVYIRDALELFRVDMLNSKDISENERGLTENLELILDRSRRPTGLIFKSESMENRNQGNSPAVDIGVFWELPGQSVSRWPRITVIEAKRLDSRLGNQRRCEYVCGHQQNGKHMPCGGIERYKKGIHGKDISTKAMLLGYVQTDDFQTWRCHINAWIANLAKETGHKPAWKAEELLRDVRNTNGLGESLSDVYRADDILPLVHLWVDLTGTNNGGTADD